MKKRTHTIIPLICGVLCATAPSYAQSVINSSGGSAEINNQTFEWSIGELIIATKTSTALELTQGLLQPSEEHIGIANIVDQSKLVAIYPNPVTDILNIAPRLQPNSLLKYQLIDMAGKSILSKEVRLPDGHEKQKLDLRNLVPAIYLLNIQIDEQTRTKGISYLLSKQD